MISLCIQREGKFKNQEKRKCFSYEDFKMKISFMIDTMYRPIYDILY